jgi:hypothetical protein
MYFGELKMRFIRTGTIHIIWYIRNFSDCFDVSKCVFHFKYDLQSSSSYLVSKDITTQISINLLDCYRLYEGFLNDILR